MSLKKQVNQVTRLGPNFLKDYLKNNPNAFAYDVTYGSAEFVPAMTVVQRLNELKDIFKKERLAHPERTLKEHRQAIIDNYPDMKKFSETHPTYYESMTNPKLTMGEAKRMYHMCYLKDQMEKGELTEQEAEIQMRDYLLKEVGKPLTPEQQLEYQRTGQLPEGLRDELTMARVGRKLGLQLPPRYQKLLDEEDNQVIPIKE